MNDGNIIDRMRSLAASSSCRNARLSFFPNSVDQIALHDVCGDDIGMQAFTGIFNPERVLPVANSPTPDNKGNGGFWTSTFDPECGSDWIRFCRSSHVKGVDVVTLLQVETRAKLICIDSLDDLRRMVARFPRDDDRKEIPAFRRKYADYRRASTRFDGIHLTEKGLDETSEFLPFGGRPDLYGWDCECTWMFSADKVVYCGKMPVRPEWLAAGE